MSKYFKISGYWKDDKSEFSDMIVKEFDDVEEDRDDEIFYYGLGENEIIENMGHPERSCLDFVITSYEEFEF